MPRPSLAVLFYLMFDLFFSFFFFFNDTATTEIYTLSLHDALPISTRRANLADVAVHLHPDDEVAVARVPLPPGMRVRTQYGEVRVSRLVPSGHKVALRAVV